MYFVKYFEILNVLHERIALSKVPRATWWYNLLQSIKLLSKIELKVFERTQEERCVSIKYLFIRIQYE